MSALNILKAALKAVKEDCFHLAKQHGIFLEQDELGNIWISEDGKECYRVNGWYLTNKELRDIISKKENKDLGKV
ncbi:hypothetical protein [Microcystis phage MaeS]|nr:hypothetical protein [Microcystis phage MaeS]